MVDASVIALCMACVYAFSFSYPTLFPEYPWLWSINFGLTGPELLAKYTEFDGGWYKPTELFVYFVLLGKVLDWHSVYQFRAVTLLELYALALLIYAVVRKGFPRDRPAALFTAVLFVAHPTLFIITYENLGQVLLYALFVVGSALCYLSLLRPSRWASWGMLGLGVFLYVGALTCREQSVALPAVLLATYVIERLSRPAGASAGFVNRLKVAFIALTGVATAIYWHLHVSRMSPMAGGYRNVFVWSWVRRNAIVLPEWFVYYFSDPESSFLLKPNARPLNTVVGAVLALATMGFWAWAIKKTGKKALTEVAYLTIWTLGFLAIPIYSGGEPWHVLLPVAAVSTLFGVALARMADLSSRVALRRGSLALLLALLTAQGAYNFHEQFLHARPGLYRMNSEAVTHPPVPREAMPRGALVYYDSMDESDWIFGAGHLFDFTYLDHELKQRGITEAERGQLEIVGAWLAAPHALYFSWRDDRWWRNDTEAYRVVALERMHMFVAECVAANQCALVQPRLKTIVEQHPELEVLHKQVDCLSAPKDQAAPDCPTVLSQTQP